MSEKNGNYNKSTCGLAQIHFVYPWFEKCHFTHLRFTPFVSRNLPLLKTRVNIYFCSHFMSLSSQNKKHKQKQEKKKIKKLRFGKN